MSVSIKKVFPVLALSIFSSMLGVGIISPLLPLYAEDLGASGIWLGLIFASFSISRSVVMPFAGRLSDRIGRKVFLSGGLLIFSLTSLGYIWAGSALGLTTVRFLQGISGGIVLPVAQAYVADLAPRGEEGKWMGYSNFAFFTGFAIGPLMGGILSEHFGMDSAFYTMAGLNMMAFFATGFFMPESHHHRESARPQASFREIAASNMMRGLFSFRFGFSIGRGIFSTFVPVLAGIYLGMSTSLIGILLTVNSLAMSLLQIPGGRIADKLNKRSLIILGTLINVTAVALIPSATGFWWLFGICTFIGIASATAMPSASVLTMEEGRRFGMGTVMGVFSLAFSLGMIVGPLAAGVVADYLNIKLVFYMSATIIFFGAIFFSLFTRRPDRA